MATTPTTTFHLTAITDGSIAKTHLGAKEKANRSWCGVDLLVADDPRFGGRYKDIVFTASPDLETVDCGACKRTAAWKRRKGGRYTVPAVKPKAAPEAAAAAQPPATNAPQRVVSGESVIEPDPETGLPRIKPEVQARADAIVAAQTAGR